MPPFININKKKHYIGNCKKKKEIVKIIMPTTLG